MAECQTCPHARWADSDLLCDVELPQNLMKFLGIESPFEVPPVPTHPQWGCVLHPEKDR